MAHRVMVLKDGEVVEQATAWTYCRLNAYTKALIEAAHLH